MSLILKQTMRKINLILFFALFTLISCGSKLDSAKESLVGTWQVNEIFKNIPATGLSEEDKSGSGVFEFTSTQCDYNFTFGMEVEMNSFGYEFQTSKENAGFTKVDRFDVIGEENYRVRFGDQTSDAHKEATEMTLERTVVTDSLTFEYSISLSKM